MFQRLVCSKMAVFAILLSCFLQSGTAFSEHLYKCVTDGKTSYQSEPCKTGGDVIKILAGPSDEDVRAAKNRNAADAAKLKEIEEQKAIASRNQEGTKRFMPGLGKIDCSTVDKELADAYGQRNGMIRASRGTFVSGEMAKIDQQNSDAVNARIQSATARRSQCRSDQGLPPN